jgi:hypothetical protein
VIFELISISDRIKGLPWRGMSSFVYVLLIRIQCRFELATTFETRSGPGIDWIL